MTPEKFISLVPRFRNHKELAGELLARSRTQAVSAGAQLYLEGDACSAIVFLLEGEIRVYKIGESGREITLYRIEPGETCILNASCILGGHSYPAHASAVVKGRMLLVPAADFRYLMERYEPLRAFVFFLLSQRLAEVMELVNEVTFARLDDRLFDYLVEKSAGGILQATHQNIANDLGTSREVVSRLLKDMERKGMVSLARNTITFTLQSDIAAIPGPG